MEPADGRGEEPNRSPQNPPVKEYERGGDSKKKVGKATIGIKLCGGQISKREKFMTPACLSTGERAGRKCTPDKLT